MEQYSVRTSPHVRDTDTTARIMWTVTLALCPAFVGALYVFGYYAGLVTVTCVLACVASEALIQKIRGVPVTVSDGSAVVTGMLLAFVLPPDVPLWVGAFGSVIAIGLAKQIFGGLGHNIWNPALVGRAVLQLSFPTLVNRGAWPILRGAPEGGFDWSRFIMDIRDQGAAAGTAVTDAITQASPLAMSSADGTSAGYNPHWVGDGAQALRLWLGVEPGSLGETSFILLALGGIALILMKRVKWQLPVFYIGTVALLTWIFPYHKAAFSTTGYFAGDPLYHVAFGGLALGAFFMATDMVTSPLTTRGQIIFAVGCGALTAVIRLYGGYPEGVCYSILIMNTTVPLIDRFTRPRLFGTKGRKAA